MRSAVSIVSLWSLTAYSRWGRPVYTTASQQDWDPAELLAGTYYYLLRHPTGPTYKGWLKIVR